MNLHFDLNILLFLLFLGEEGGGGGASYITLTKILCQ